MSDCASCGLQMAEARKCLHCDAEYHPACFDKLDKKAEWRSCTQCGRWTK